MQRLLVLAALATTADMATTSTSSVNPAALQTSLPTCAQACLQTVSPAQGSCSSDDTHCLCGNTLYVDSLACCLTNSCIESDQKKASQINKEICDAVGITIPYSVSCAANVSSEIASAIISASSSVVSVALSGMSISAAATPTASTIAAFEAAPSVATTGQIVSYTGEALLTGSCTTPVYAYATLDADAGGGVVEFPWMGCSNENADCCPIDPNKGGQLSVCPSDYITTSSACCPFGWSIYTTALASQTPCFTSLPLPLIPNNATNNPTFTAGLFIMSTSLFALQYSLAPPRAPVSFNTAVVAGIAVGGAAALTIFIFAIFYCFRRRRDPSAAQNIHTPLTSPLMNKNNDNNNTFSGPLSRGPTSEAYTASSGRSEVGSPSTPKHRATVPPEQQMWFPMPPQLQQTSRPMSQVSSPRELVGDTFVREHHPAMATQRSRTPVHGNIGMTPFTARPATEEPEKDGMMW